MPGHLESMKNGVHSPVPEQNIVLCTVEHAGLGCVAPRAWTCTDSPLKPFDLVHLYNSVPTEYVRTYIVHFVSTLGP